MQFEVHGGNFGSGTGTLYGSRLTLPKKGWGSHALDTFSIASVELASEERLKKLSGTLGWGAVGAVALGPLGMFAGLLVGGRKTRSTFIVTLKDGNAFVATGEQKVFVGLTSAAITNGPAASPSRCGATEIRQEAQEKPALTGRVRSEDEFQATCETWGWMARLQPKSGFQRYEIYVCENGGRRIAVAVTSDNVTDHAFNQISNALDEPDGCEERYIVAPTIAASMQRAIKKSGVKVADPSAFNDVIANW